MDHHVPYYLWVCVMQDCVSGVIAAHLDAELHQPERDRVVHLLGVAGHALYRHVQHGRVPHAADLSHVSFRDYVD